MAPLAYLLVELTSVGAIYAERADIAHTAPAASDPASPTLAAAASGLGHAGWLAALALLIVAGLGWLVAIRRRRHLLAHGRQLADRLASLSSALHEREREVETTRAELYQTRDALQRSNDELTEIGRDMAERERQQLRTSEARNAFIGHISHELRTPMSGILGMTELALQTELSAEQREYLDSVETAGQALLVLLNDLVDLSRIESGKLALDPVRFRPRRCLAAAVKTMAPAAHSKGLDLICDIAPTVPQKLLGDPHRLRQIVINLISNAIKFTERGEVVVKMESHDHGAATDSERWHAHLTVRDTGVGIPADRQDRIFKSFMQADR
ncbi:MAG: histidine kinase dimerization/phospho-acceptor domain-containing protein, partial [Myxococcota bacterium]